MSSAEGESTSSNDSFSQMHADPPLDHFYSMTPVSIVDMGGKHNMRVKKVHTFKLQNLKDTTGDVYSKIEEVVQSVFDRILRDEPKSRKFTVTIVHKSLYYKNNSFYIPLSCERNIGEKIRIQMQKWLQSGVMFDFGDPMTIEITLMSVPV